MSAAPAEQYEVEDLDAAALLDLAAANERELREREVLKLRLAYQWAILHPATDVWDSAGVVFGEDVIPIAGEGAPLVAEFAPAELAAVLGWKTETVEALMGDALELSCRLPRVYDDVQKLRLPLTLGRYIAEQTRDLDPASAHEVDQALRGGGKLTRAFIRRVVDDVRLHEDPDRAVADEENALAARKVEVRPGRTPATLSVEMDLDVPDGLAFAGAVALVADRLKDLGDTDDLDIRRARAVGILADPEAALALLNGDPSPTSRAAGTANLLLNLDLATLAELAVRGVTGPVGVERWGTATTELIKRWVTEWLGADAKIVVRPFHDLSDPATLTPVDGHDPPEQMAWFVRLRDPVCVFPGCTRPSPQCDLDHIEAYVPPDDGGPPGQTHPDNLAPLCRGHHRAKTHGRWSYRRLPDGGYRWTTPTGRTIDVPPARRVGADLSR